MKTNNLIKAIFTNVLFVIGVILIIFGFVRGAITLTYISMFDKYPLDQYQETMCDTNYATRPLANDKSEVTFGMNETEAKDAKVRCEKQTERQRNINKATDVASAITTLISGAVLVYFFRRFIFGK